MKNKNFESRVLSSDGELGLWLKSYNKATRSALKPRDITGLEIHGVFIEDRLLAGFALEWAPLLRTLAGTRLDLGHAKGLAGIVYFWMSETYRSPFVVKCTWSLLLSTIIARKKRMKRLVFVVQHDILATLCQRLGFAELLPSLFMAKVSWWNLLKVFKIILIKPRNLPPLPGVG